jgi:molybdopterin converting factor small subunit
VKVRVRLFAVAKQLAQQELIDVEIPAGGTVGDLRLAIVEQYPPLADVIPSVLFSVDAEYAGDDVPIHEESEIGCIPPVSGG